MSQTEFPTAVGDPQAGRHGHDDEHPPYLAHHFDTPKQQLDSAKLGMWVFLATELLMFGGLFCAYAVWRSNNFAAFEIGHVYLDTTWGAINTVVLIASSFTMAWAVRAIQLNQQRLCFILMGLTFLGGVLFMCIKAEEYNTKFSHGMGPGRLYEAPERAAAEAAEIGIGGAEAASAAGGGASAGVGPGAANRTILPGAGEPPAGFAPSGEETDAVADHGEHGGEDHHAYFASHGHGPGHLLEARTFFSIYFLMTGLHGIHVLIGMGLIAWVMVRVYRSEFSAAYNTPVDIVGLYWHLVDLIWIFLFPLLYLI